MEPDRILAQLPSPMARDLIRVGLANEVPRVRAGISLDVDLLVTISQTAATVVTLVQTPETLRYVFTLLGHRFHTTAASPARIVIKAKGSRGRIELDLDADTPAAEIARVLRLLV